VGITIGRFGRSPAGAGLEVDVQSFRHQGDTLTVSGDLMPAAGDSDGINTMRAMRAQLAGYVSDGGDGEAFVPVVWADDPHYDGIYRLTSADITATDVTLAAGRANWSATLQRVVHSSAPWAEYRTSLVLMSNAHSYVPITNINPAQASVPGSVTEIRTDTAAIVTGTGLVAGFDGDERRIRPGWLGTGETVRRSNYRVRVTPADWYVGAATVEGQWGSNWYPLVSRQAPPEIADNIRIRNGLMRVTPVAAGLTCEWWADGAWESSATFRLWENGNQFTTLRNVSILRNSPEMVTLRCTYSTAAAPTFIYDVDVTIRRGSRTAPVVVSGGLGVSLTAARIDFGSTTASTAVTSVTAGVIRKTTNDASGNRPVIMCAEANTQDLVNGTLVTSGTVAAARFAIGLEVPGGTATAGERAIDLAGDFFGALAQRLTVVGR
jgi:hypothetical protein